MIMIDMPTVLILGAGASKPYGYPVGTELKELIIRNLESKYIKFHYTPNQISNFKDKLMNSRLYTIDKFLEGYGEEFGAIGKLAIAHEIISNESIDVYSCKAAEDWYGYLCNSLHTSTFEEFFENKLDIITFNYDRSLEEYLFKALENFYPETSAADLVQSIKIIHMYGKLDHLPKEEWEDGKKREYGSMPSDNSLVESSEGIKLIYESKEEGSFSEAHKMLRKAERVYFMGFGYDKTNLDNLNIIENFLEKKDDQTTFLQNASGTGFGLPQSVRNSIFSYNERIKIDNESIDCLNFLKRNGL